DVEPSPTSWSARASAKFARYSSSVSLLRPVYSMERSRSSCGCGLLRAKYHGSFSLGMKICGCRRSASYSAVVPHFACPTMKKSGMRAPPWAGASRGVARSADAVIAPQGHEIASEVLAQGDDLTLETDTELFHERGVCRG